MTCRPAPRGLSLDDECPQAFGCAVDGGGETRRAGADDQGVVFGGLSLGAEPEQLGDAAKLRSYDRLALDEPDHRPVAGVGQRSAPGLERIRGVGLEPGEADLVAVEEVTKLGAGGIPALPDHDRARRRRVGGEPLQPPCPGHPVARKGADRLGDDRIHRCDRVVLGRLDPEHARLDGGAETNREDCSEHDRNLPEDIAGQTLPDHPRRPVDHLHRFDPAFEHGEQGAILPLVRGVLARHQAHVRRRAGKTPVLRGAEHRKDLDPGDLLRRHHVVDSQRRPGNHPVLAGETPTSGTCGRRRQLIAATIEIPRSALGFRSDRMMGREGIEPSTLGLRVPCSTS